MNILITGAGRGIGLALTQHYLPEHKVFATARNQDALEQLSTMGAKALALDLNDPTSFATLAGQLSDTPLDVVIHNAGVLYREGTLADINADAFAHSFAVNATAPLLLSRALQANLEAGQGRKVAFISSVMGSISENQSGGQYSYRASKAALNAAARSLALQWASLPIHVGIYHPGWVQTDMGGSQAPVHVIDSANGLAQQIDALDAERSGQFFAFDGRALPW
ncbi:SDR family oxidoreductase [Gallaecimonas sp. GXIMD1310]|uniref:SDR family oxidoreductase n=1 Tax=Gallaecimonas sp. GXIMD1310 TaxID=3131926 RepID=UPI0032558130